MCDVGHHKPPREILAYSHVEAEGQPSVGGDGSAISRVEVIIYTLLALCFELAGGHAEVRTPVYQPLLTGLVSAEEAAGGCRCRAGYNFAPGL
jgi:hypothetical protein